MSFLLLLQRRGCIRVILIGPHDNRNNVLFGIKILSFKIDLFVLLFDKFIVLHFNGMKITYYKITPKGLDLIEGNAEVDSGILIPREA